MPFFETKPHVKSKNTYYDWKLIQWCIYTINKKNYKKLNKNCCFSIIMSIFILQKDFLVYAKVVGLKMTFSPLTFYLVSVTRALHSSVLVQLHSSTQLITILVSSNKKASFLLVFLEIAGSTHSSILGSYYTKSSYDSEILVKIWFLARLHETTPTSIFQGTFVIYTFIVEELSHTTLSLLHYCQTFIQTLCSRKDLIL